MRDRLGLIALIIAAILLLAVVALVVSRSRPEPPVTGPTPANAAPGPDTAENAAGSDQDVRLSDVSLTVKEEGEVVWRAAFGGEVEMYSDRKVASATDVLWEFQGRGFSDLTLKAPLMRAAWDERRLTFSGGVLIESEGGRLRFSCDNAEYQFDTHKVIGRGDVRFQRGNYYGRSQEVVVDNDRKIVRLKRGSLSLVQ